MFDVSFVISLSSDIQIQYGGGNHLENCIFDSLALHAVERMICGVFWGEKAVSVVVLMIIFSYDFQIQDDNFQLFSPIS